MLGSLLLLAAPFQTAELVQRWERGERLEAIAEAAQALEASPDDSALRRTLIEWELAVHRYEAALGHMGPPPSAFDARRGRALYALGRLEEALPFLGPDQALARLDALEALGRAEEAGAALEEAAQRLGEEHPGVGCARAKRLAAAGDDAGAAERYRAVLEREPLRLEALFGLGHALARQGQREEALVVLERHRALVPLMDELDFAVRGLDLAPNHAPNRAALADVQARLGLLDLAAQSYSRAARDARGGEVVPIALRHARFHEEQRGDADAAVDVLEAAAASTPRDARLWVRAGDSLARAGDPAGAHAHYQRALALRPNDAAILQRAEKTQP